MDSEFNVIWAVQIQDDNSDPNINQRVNYKLGILTVVNDHTLFTIDSTDGTMLGAKALETNYIFIGIVKEYEWVSDMTYAIVRNSLSTTQDIQLETFNIVSQTATTSLKLPYADQIVFQYGRIGSGAVVKHFVTIIQDVYYAFDDTMNVVYQADLTVCMPIYAYDILLGDKSYAVSYFPI